MGHDRLSIYLSYLLRHNPEELGLDMDIHGWVPVEQLIQRINERGKHRITRALLEEIVAQDAKGRYRLDGSGQRIKACQGHSIPWVQPELTPAQPPAVLYHGTTMQAYGLIRKSGAILRMSRHAVHMQAQKESAWQSAKRWKQNPVILVIDAEQMHRDGYAFAVSDNGVWCTEQVPVGYVKELLYQL